MAALVHLATMVQHNIHPLHVHCDASPALCTLQDHLLSPTEYHTPARATQWHRCNFNALILCLGDRWLCVHLPHPELPSHPWHPRLLLLYPLHAWLLSVPIGPIPLSHILVHSDIHTDSLRYDIKPGVVMEHIQPGRDAAGQHYDATCTFVLLATDIAVYWVHNREGEGKYHPWLKPFVAIGGGVHDQRPGIQVHQE